MDYHERASRSSVLLANSEESSPGTNHPHHNIPNNPKGCWETRDNDLFPTPRPLKSYTSARWGLGFRGDVDVGAEAVRRRLFGKSHSASSASILQAGLDVDVAGADRDGENFRDLLSQFFDQGEGAGSPLGGCQGDRIATHSVLGVLAKSLMLAGRRGTLVVA